MIKTPDWYKETPCKGRDRLFFSSDKADRNTAKKICVKTRKNEIIIYHLQKYIRSNQETVINQRPVVWPGEFVQSGQIISDGPAIVSIPTLPYSCFFASVTNELPGPTILSTLLILSVPKV